MTTWQEMEFIALCLEGFFYGMNPFHVLKLVPLLKKSNYSPPDLGLYSGIFAMYLHCSSNNSRMAIILFYALCLLYVLSTATVVSDLVALILQVSNNPICKNIIFFISCIVAYEYYTIASTSD